MFANDRPSTAGPGERGTSLPGAERGTSLVETIVAVACLSVVMSAAMIYIVTSWRFSEFNRDKVFAYEKAVSILTEMQAHLEASGVEAASDLDSYDDGITYKTALTITRDPTDPLLFVLPNHTASGNIQAVGQWRWVRQITVAPFPGVPSRDLRIVTVKIYRGRDGVDPTTDATGLTKYAEVSSVLRTIADAYPTSQVYDIYLLAIENVPGWWVFMDAIRPFIETTIDDLQSRNPGLRFRSHWITKSGYGRDPWYRPFWNTVNDSKTNVNFVHFYPSKMPPIDLGADLIPSGDDVISSAFYYVPEALQGWARTEVSASNPAGELNGYTVALTALDPLGNPIPNLGYNPFPYTLADQWNHCQRSVDEEAWFRLRRTYGATIAGSVGTEDDAAPTWHMLLDRMKSSPTLYRNAIFINLHGELLPMPPMRGYSDAAKDPRPALTATVTNQRFYSYDANPLNFSGGHPGVRVVTHPTQQKYVRVPGSPATSGDVQLRVYAYHEDPQEVVSFPVGGTPCPDILSDPIEIQVYGVDLAQRVEQVSPIPGLPGPPVLTTSWLPPNVAAAPYWINLGTLIGGPVTQARNTWLGAQFPVAAGAARSVIGAANLPYLTLEAMRGGVNVTPLLNPGATLVDAGERYDWIKPQVLGLGEGAFNNRWIGYPAAFGAVVAPIAPNYQTSSTFRPEGYLMGWYMNGSYNYNGALPVARCGYVPPEMDPEGVGYTMIRLYNTPLKTPLVGALGAERGLQSAFSAGNNYRLYGRDYIPTTCEAANNFTQDLSTVGLALEKNTARWRITISKTALGLPVRVRNPRTGTWVAITAADPDHPSDADDSDHWPLTVTTRIGCRVQDYRNDGDVAPSELPQAYLDTEEAYLWNNWAIGPVYNATCYTTMEVIDRALYPGAMRPDPVLVPLVGPTAFTYTGGLRVRIPDGLELPANSGFRQPLTGAPASGWPATHRPENLSTTYFWWSDRTADVPASEQAQFMGDPRHCPYADFKTGNFPNSYNWYFDNFRNAADGNPVARWPGFDAARIRNTLGDTNDGWMGRSELDVARMMKTLRESLAEANMLWTTLTGWSYYYMGIGNEIGYDSANGYVNSIPVNGMPWGQVAGNWGYEQSILSGGPGGMPGYLGLGGGPGVKIIRSNSTTAWLKNTAGPPAGQSFWWAASWLGEMYPDSAYGTVVSTGSLPSGNAGTSYSQTRRTSIPRNNGNVATQPIGLPYGTAFSDFIAERRLQNEGCTSFFNIGVVGSTFHHTGHASTPESGQLTAGPGSGTELAAAYNFPLPTLTKVSRPFNIALAVSGTEPSEFTFTEYAAPNRYAATTAMRLYDDTASAPAGQIGSGLIVNQDPGTAARAAYILVNGLDRVTESGSSFISRYAMVSLIHTFLGGGYVPVFPLPPNGVTVANRIAQLPRVTVVAPTILTQLTNPATVSVQWRVEYTRWDGLPYTGQYPVPWGEYGLEANLSYVPMWSSDNGTNWISMVDNLTPILPGTRPANAALIRTDAAVGVDETFVWPTPAVTFPRASYLIRVDCYRGLNWLHYSFHQEKIYIDR